MEEIQILNQGLTQSFLDLNRTTTMWQDNGGGRLTAGPADAKRAGS